MRWYVFIIAMVILLTIVEQINADAVFQLDLKSFVNYNGLNINGHCCSGYKDSFGECSDTCQTKFRVCLNVYQQQINLESSCTFGEKMTSVLGENNINFNAVQFQMPLSFSVNSWQGTFSLIIEALHETGSNSTDLNFEGTVLNRLMTQRHLAVNQSWVSEKHSNAHNSLEYRFRVVCKENYHGNQCSKWCGPRDDTFGHYTCDAEGNRVCLEGWESKGKEDSYCDQAICTPGCKGSCDRPNECNCSPGFDGPKCDQCRVYPGCEHGTCSKPWECNCNEGWGGLLCKQDLNFCTNHKPCKNGATCLNTGVPGSYSCLCAPGFNGTNCEIVNDSCTHNPCQSGGTCLHTDGDGGFVCQCRTSFSGRYCEVKNEMCFSRPCANNARCTDGQTGYQCHCPPGFRGTRCEKPICRNGGAFVDGDSHYKCQCKAGFLGRFCEINVDDCQAKPCGNGGTCIDGVNTVKCLCRPGWSGKFCNEKIPPCTSRPCENGGLCSPAPELSSGFRCTCPQGFLGPRCSIVQDSFVKHEAQEMAEPMSTMKIVLIVTFSVAVPILALGFFIAIRCMKQKRRRDFDKADEEARRQNEQNVVHNAVNNKFADKMIFNSLEYPAKPINTDYQQAVNSDPKCKGISTYSKGGVENAYTIVPARSTKNINSDVSRLSLACKLEKDLDAYTMSRNSPCSQVSCKTPDPHLSRTQSHGDVFSKRPTSCTNSNINNSGEACMSTNTLSTCTTPSSVYVIEEHYEDDDYIATQV